MYFQFYRCNMSASCCICPCVCVCVCTCSMGVSERQCICTHINVGCALAELLTQTGHESGTPDCCLLHRSGHSACSRTLNCEFERKKKKTTTPQSGSERKFLKCLTCNLKTFPQILCKGPCLVMLAVCIPVVVVVVVVVIIKGWLCPEWPKNMFSNLPRVIFEPCEKGDCIRRWEGKKKRIYSCKISKIININIPDSTEAEKILYCKLVQLVLVIFFFYFYFAAT